jgi:uncharacterized protein
MFDLVSHFQRFKPQVSQCSKTTVLFFGKIVVGFYLISMSSCNFQPRQVSLSSGTAGGYYNRLGQQLGESVKSTVDVTVQN